MLLYKKKQKNKQKTKSELVSYNTIQYNIQQHNTILARKFI
jgi:hypothetical protein